MAGIKGKCGGWNRGLKGYTNTGSFKRGQTIAEHNYKWKGDNVGYVALHGWVRRMLGTPNKCEKCSDTSNRKYEWANISGEYKRDITDWIRVCVPCHAALDQYVFKAWKTRKASAIC